MYGMTPVQALVWEARKTMTCSKETKEPETKPNTESNENKGNRWFIEKLCKIPANDPSLFKCKKCPKLFFSETKLYKHMDKGCKAKVDTNYWRDTFENRKKWRRS
jgi:hypothetical protein